MKKLLQTKTVLIALFVAVPALAAGTAAALGGGGDEGSTSVVQPVDLQPAADREDDVTAAEDGVADDNGDAPHHVKPKAHTQSDPADTEEQDAEQADEDDQGESEQADEDDQGDNEDVQEDDQGEDTDAQGDEDDQGDQGDQGDDTSDDQGGDD
jgi:hypothetical protein